MTLTSISFLFITSLVNSFGLAASASSGIGSKIDGFATMPSLALSSAVASMAGQNIGAGNHDRVKETLKIGLMCPLMIRAFMREAAGANGKDTIEMGRVYINICTYSYLILTVLFTFNAIANGSGNTLFALINSFISVLILRIPLAYLLDVTFNWGIQGFCCPGFRPCRGHGSGDSIFPVGQMEKGKHQ